MAESIVFGAMTEIGPANSGKYELLITCTADTDGSFGVTLTTAQMQAFAGKYLYMISAYPGSPAMTDGAELEIRDSLQRVIMDAAGNGNDFIDATSTTTEYPSGPNTDHYWIANDAYPWSIYIENNIVNGGKTNLLFTFID